MNAFWDPQQREWLQAMGYRVWRLGGGEPEPEPAAMPVAAEALDRVGDVARPVTPARPAAAPRAVRQAEQALVEPAGHGPAAAAPLPTPTGNERRLYRSLLRATGQRTTRAAEALLGQLQVDLPAMRDDPAAKRALWSRLRALRKASERR